MKVEADKMKAGFDLLDNIADNPALPDSRFVGLVAAKGKARMRMTGMAEGEAVMDCDGDVAFVADRRALGSFLGAASGTITCERTPKGVMLRSAGRRLQFTEPEGSAPQSAFQVPTNGQRSVALEALTLLSDYAKAGQGDPGLEVIYSKTDYGCVATDSIAVCGVLNKGVKQDFLLPRFVASLAAKDPASEVSVDKNGALLKTAAGRIYQPLPADGAAYPVQTVTGVMDRALKAQEAFAFDPDPMLEAIKYLSSFQWALLAGANAVLKVQPLADKPRVQVNLDSATVATATSVPVQFGKAKCPEGGWVVLPTWAEPWLTYVKGLGVKASFAEADGMSCYRAEKDGVKYILAVAGLA